MDIESVDRFEGSAALACGLDEAVVWAALSAHVLERLGVKAPILVSVSVGGARRDFSCPSTEDRTLRDACAAIVRAHVAPSWSLVVERASVRLAGSADASSQIGPVDPSRALDALACEATAAPDRRLSDCTLVDAEERERLARWGRADATVEAPASFLEHVLVTSRAAVVVDRHGRAPLSSILERAVALGAALRASGVARGDFVAVHTARDASYLVGIFGAWLAGAAFVPLDARFPAERLAAMIEDARVRCVVHDAVAGPGAFAPSIVRVAIPELGAPLDAEAISHACGGNDDAYVLYTSGSTGRPKGVAISHANLTTFLAAMTHRPGLRADEPLLALTSFSFDISLLELLLPLWVGGTLVIAHEETLTDPDAVAALVATHCIAVVQGTPTTFRLLLASADLPPLRRFVGGEAFPRDLAAELCARGGETWNMYGPTETTIWSAHGRVAAAPTQAVVPLGRPIANTFFRIVDARGRLLPWGARGELLIGGDGVGRGYLGRDELTSTRFVSDPSGLSDGRVYRTGDAVRLEADGALVFLGRLDNQVKVRGYRIELGEVEVALRRAAGVSESAATVHDLGGTATLVGYVVAPSVEPASLRERLAASLPSYMVPTFIERLDTLPLTGNRKLDRSALPPPSRPRIDGVVLTPTESIVLHAISEAFGTAAIALDDDFSLLGGFSLSRFRAAKLLHHAGLTVDGATLFELPTVRSLAAHLAARPTVASLASLESGARPSHADAVTENQIEIVEDAQGVTRRWTHTMVSPLRADVDLGRLEAVFRQTFARHADILSSLARDPATGRVSRVTHRADFEWDLRRMDLEPVRFEEHGPVGGIVDVMTATSERGFDVGKGPLHRFVVIDGRERYLVWSTHDTTFDAWSSAVLRDEIGLGYEGTAGVLPPARRYLDHVLREREATERLLPELEKHYRTRANVGPLDPGRAPTARTAARFPFDPELARTAARRWELGPTVLLEAAFALALAKSRCPALMAGPGRVAFGVYASNRAVAEELGVGDYDSLVPLALGIDPDMPLEAWLASLKMEARAGLRFEAVGTRTWLSHLDPKSRARAWRIRLNDGQFPLNVGLPKPKRTLFAPPGEVFIPPTVRLPGLDLEVGAMMGRPFLSALYDETSVPPAVAAKLLSDLADVAVRLGSMAPAQRLRDLL